MDNLLLAATVRRYLFEMLKIRIVFLPIYLMQFFSNLLDKISKKGYILKLKKFNY